MLDTIASNPGFSRPDFIYSPIFLQGCEIKSGRGRPGFEASSILSVLIDVTYLQNPVMLQCLLRCHSLGGVPVQTFPDEVQKLHVVGLDSRRQVSGVWPTLPSLGVGNATGIPLRVCACVCVCVCGCGWGREGDYQAYGCREVPNMNTYRFEPLKCDRHNTS